LFRLVCQSRSGEAALAALEISSYFSNMNKAGHAEQLGRLEIAQRAFRDFFAGGATVL